MKRSFYFLGEASFSDETPKGCCILVGEKTRIHGNLSATSPAEHFDNTLFMDAIDDKRQIK